MRNDGVGRADAMQRDLSSVRQFEAFLHPSQSVRQPIDAFGKLRNFHMNLRKFNMNVRDLALDRTNTVLQFANVVARSVNYAADVAKMLKNNVVRLNHRLKLLQKSIVVNSDRQLQLITSSAFCTSPGAG